MIVGFTGTQLGLNVKQLMSLHKFFEDTIIDEFHHGDCIGADEEAHKLYVAELGAEKVVIHPPENPSKRAWCDKISGYEREIKVLVEKPYLDRNKDIVNACELLIICPKNEIEEVRSGTWSTYRYAESRIPRLLIL